MNIKNKLPEIVNNALRLHKVSLRDFARKLTESLPSEQMSHATIINWRNGKSEPDTDFLESMLVAYKPQDWRHIFALACLGAKSPLVWGCDGVVWKLIEAVEKDPSAERSVR